MKQIVLALVIVLANLTSVVLISKGYSLDEKHKIDQPVKFIKSGVLKINLLSQIKTKKYSKALEIVNQYLEIKKDDWYAWHLKGFILHNLKKEAKAEETFKNALRLHPDYVKVLNELGVKEAKSSNGDLALYWFQKAVKFDPNYELSQFNLGKALILSKTDHEKGVRILSKIAKQSTPRGKRAKAFLSKVKK